MFAGELITVRVRNPLESFVTAWCLTHSDPTSSWIIHFLHSLSLVHFEKQLRGLDCLSQGHQHGRIVGLHVDADCSPKILLDLPKLHPYTQRVEYLYLTSSSRSEADEFATHLSTLYPHLEHLAIGNSQGLSPVLCRLHELTLLTSVAVKTLSFESSLPPQQCPFLKSMRLSTYIPSLVLPNMNTLQLLGLRCPLTRADISGVCSGLCQTTSLGTIVLDSTKLSPSGAKVLAAGFKQNKSLEKVYVRDETIGDKGVWVLEEVLNNHSTVKSIIVESKDPQGYK